MQPHRPWEPLHESKEGDMSITVRASLPTSTTSLEFSCLSTVFTRMTHPSQ